ncbi:hypothetical protein [Pararhizobium sp.]|uniref:hypothetical protein n=1 Tax=Pararhizobium sp. TaxID=1977563 RepID=UPI00271C6F35|nr:hypothetical protein [Pararhizobium sp.]MDO9417076.1 hypothetical protein [Pararhizobium sp.]
MGDRNDYEEAEYRRRRMLRRVQPQLRKAATEVGLFTGCTLPKCRRAKQCLGRHPDEIIGGGDFKRFPPCVRSQELHHALIRGLQQVEERTERALLAKGYSPEEIDRMAKDNHRALDEDEDWPDDPLATTMSVSGSASAPASKAVSRRGRRPARLPASRSCR